MVWNTGNFWLKGIVGQPAPQSDGVETTGRFNRVAGLVTSNVLDNFYEQTVRGNRYALSLAVTTSGIAAGNLNAASAAASTNFALWNPIGSGINISLSKFFVSLFSGTVPAGPINHSWGTAPTIASVVTNGFIGSTLVGTGRNGLARGAAVSAGTTLTGGGALSILRASPFYFTAGSGADLGGQIFEEDINGGIVIPPGYMWVPTWSGAGTSVLSGYSVEYEEVPI